MSRRHERAILNWLRANEKHLVNGPTPKWMAFLRMQKELGLNGVNFEAFCRVSLYALTRGDLKCWRGRATNGNTTPLLFTRKGEAAVGV